MIIKMNRNTKTSVLIIFDILYIFINIFFIIKISAEVVPAAKPLNPKPACIEYAYKLFNVCKAYQMYLIHSTIKYFDQMTIIDF